MISLVNKYFILLILIISFVCSNEISDDVQQKLNDVVKDINRAPDFTLKSINADSIYTLSKLHEKVILINFWATWCGPCRMEIPDFNELYEKYSRDKFEILSISISDTADQLKNFLKAYDIHYPILYGNQREMQKIIIDYGGVYSIPMSFLIGKNNQIKRVYPGAILKQYDQNMFSDLIFTIENSIAEDIDKKEFEKKIDK
tara:strand:- start:1083 stop:1685 length:603 start_codon:yes stop_codon:yes gene_type:complete